MWLLVVFVSLTQDKFDIVPVCALARVSFTYLHSTIYTPQMKFLATPLPPRWSEMAVERDYGVRAKMLDIL